MMVRTKILFASLCSALVGVTLAAAADEGEWNFDEAPVGQVMVLEGKAQCGGTLVGADIVMTAAHCVIPAGETTVVDPASVRFSVYGENGLARVFQVGDIAVVDGFEHREVPTREQITQDVALLKLTEFTGEASDSIAAVDPDADYVALLPADESDVFAGEPCKATYEENGVMVLACSRERGASGSPVYSMIDGSRKVVGVISADGRLSDERVLFAINPIGLLERLEWVSERVARPTGH